MSDAIARGTVTVRCLDTGREWEEIVIVFERDTIDTDGSRLTVEDAARRQAKRQAGMGCYETLESDIS